MNDRKDDEERTASRARGSLCQGRRQRRRGGGAGRRASGCSAWSDDEPRTLRPWLQHLAASKGPHHEGGAADGHHSRGAAGGVRPRNCHSCSRRRRRWGRRSSRGAWVAELGPEWATQFKASSRSRRHPHRWARCIAPSAHDGRALACKLQYPDMNSAVEADLNQLKGSVRAALRAHEPGAWIRPRCCKEVSARLREELDYDLEAAHGAVRGDLRGRAAHPRAGAVLAELVDEAPANHDVARRRRLLDYKPAPLEDRNDIARAMFKAWWYPFSPLRRDPRRPAPG